MAAVVTGGRGIGLAVARAIAARQIASNVAVLSKSAASASAAAAAVERAGEAAGHRVTALGLPCDVSDAAQVDAAFAQIGEELGAPRFVVNAAGVNSDALLVRARDQAVLETIGCNLLGPIFVCRAAAKAMLRAKTDGGAIVNVGSVVGARGNAGQAVYSASKSGLAGLTKSLARELAPRGIRVNLVEPGYVSTDMTSGLDHDALAKTVPLGRLATPDEVASVVAFLLSSGESGYVTGAVLSVDGGMT